MWAGLRFLNGYSPILAAGVPREFDFRIHGEINLHEAEYLLWDLSKPDAVLDQLGVDGVVVAWDSGVSPALDADWEMVESTEEVAVYHRVGPPFQRVRSVSRIDFRPNESFASATISGIEDTRNHVTANVDVPADGAPAVLTFSRPFFRGYHASIGNLALPVDSYHGLFPVVEVPAGAHGQLTLVYRPWWLVAGGTLSIVCAGIWIFGILKAARVRVA